MTASATMPNSTMPVYSFSAPLLGGRIATLDEFRGQVLLIVNTASRCGFTPQYAGLEKLHRAYTSRGFAVLGFPSNQFGRQEPGSAAEIATFCERNFGVTFPLFAKIQVNGPGAHPLYQYLKSQQPGAFGFLTRGRIPWNFTKFLVARSGEVVARYGPRTRPERIAPEIERQLAAV
jgi:glutathione peroxidase